MLKSVYISLINEASVRENTEIMVNFRESPFPVKKLDVKNERRVREFENSGLSFYKTQRPDTFHQGKCECKTRVRQFADLNC